MLNLHFIKYSMKLVLLFISCLLLSCTTNQSTSKKNNPTDTIIISKNTDSSQLNKEQISEPEPYAIYYVIIADTGKDYYSLQNKMLTLHKSMHIKIDTMGRYFNKKKNLIALPDNDSDEIYAGSYYPRREPSENLSLEYLDYYTKNGNFSFNEGKDRTIALVRGIYGEKQVADSALIVLKQQEGEAFEIKANIYVGCMH